LEVIELMEKSKDSANVKKESFLRDTLSKVIPNPKWGFPSGRDVVDVEIQEIVRRKPFSEEFKLEGDAFDQICESMEKEGYLNYFPVFLWENKNEGKLLLDGHRRVAAAEKCDLKKVPCIIFSSGSFKDDSEAVAYIKYVQYGRRNVSVAEKFKDMVKLHKDNLLNKLPSVKGPNRLRDRIARFYGMSSATAARWLKVVKDGEEYHDRIVRGTYLPNKVFTILTEKDVEESKEVDSAVSDLVEEEKLGDLEGEDIQDVSTLKDSSSGVSGEKTRSEVAPEVRESVESGILSVFNIIHDRFLSLGSENPLGDVEKIMLLFGECGIIGIDVLLMKSLFERIKNEAVEKVK